MCACQALELLLALPDKAERSGLAVLIAQPQNEDWNFQAGIQQSLRVLSGSLISFGCVKCVYVVNAEAPVRCLCSAPVLNLERP